MRSVWGGQLILNVGFDYQLNIAHVNYFSSLKYSIYDIYDIYIIFNYTHI